MTGKQPEALLLSDIFGCDSAVICVDVATTQQLVQALRIQRAENETLQAGYAAARLEIESLQARIKTMAEEHADELMVAHMAGRMRAAQPAGAQQPGVATWTPLPGTLPEPGKPVLLDIGMEYPIRAMWAAKHTLEVGMEDDSGFGEYDEATDTYYCPEGWYEWNEHEETHWAVDETPTAWCELPPNGGASHWQAPAQAVPAAVAGPWSAGELDGNWLEIDHKDHAGVIRIVWKMEGDTRSPVCEARAMAVIDALNAYAAPTAQPAPQQEAQEPVAWPKPGPENPTWTICPKFLEKIMRSSASEYMPGLEEIEAVLLGLRTLAAAGRIPLPAWEYDPTAQPASQGNAQEPVAWYVTGCSRLLDEDEAKAEARHIGGTARAIPLYTAPQADSVQDLQPVHDAVAGPPEMQVGDGQRTEWGAIAEPARKACAEEADQIEALAAENERLRGLVVSCFDHDHPPTFRQGIPEHELEDPVTAEQCAWFVAEIERLRKEVNRFEEGNLEQELAMLLRRIVSSARRNCEDGSNVLKLANEAWSYLVRKGLNGSPLRDAGVESDNTPPAQAADSVLEDAAQRTNHAD